MTLQRLLATTCGICMALTVAAFDSTANPVIDGSCCLPDSSCVYITADEIEWCEMMGGIFIPFVLCEEDPCPEGFPCCIGEDCYLLWEEECSSYGGFLVPGFETCDPNPCARAACCHSPQCQITSLWRCTELDGEYFEDHLSCDPNPCIETTYACCLASSCAVLTYAECEMRGGVCLYGVESCDPDVCALPGDWNLSLGALIVHAPPGVQWSSTEDWCARYAADLSIQDPAEQHVRIDPPPDESRIWYVLAAWDQSKEWSAVQFGLGDYDPDDIWINDWGLCGEMALEVATPDWPGPNAGTMFSALNPWSGNCLAVYWFAGYAYESGTLPLAAHPHDGASGYMNCDSPPVFFAAQCLGELGIFRSGRACYPGPPVRYACCFDEDDCLVLTPADCLFYGGDPKEHVFTCDPDPCTAVHVCCVGGDCYLYTAPQCEAVMGRWQPDLDSCDPDPCESSGTPMTTEHAMLPRLSAHPSPFITHTQLRFELPAPTAVGVRVFDAGGRIVRTLRLDAMSAQGSISWDGCDQSGRRLPPGHYFCCLESGGRTVSQRVVVAAGSSGYRPR